MRVLLDENLPQHLRHYFSGHDVATVGYMGWRGYENGDLLDIAQTEFDVMVTMDRNLPYQQNVGARNIAVVVLVAPDNQLESLLPLIPAIMNVLETIHPGDHVLVSG